MRFALITLLLFLVGCGSGSEINNSGDTNVAVDQVSEERTTEILTAEGMILNVDTEDWHTVVGIRTTDNKLINLVFPGSHQQLVKGMNCRIKYYRLLDIEYIPDFLRDQKLDYYILEDVELMEPIEPRVEGK